MGIVFLLAFFFGGFNLSFFIFKYEKSIIKLWFGLVFSLVMLIWLPALMAFVLEFNLPSNIAGAAIAIAIGAVFFGKNRPKKFKVSKDYNWIFILIIPFIMFSIYLLSTHTILKSENGALLTGQSTYGDMSMHLAFITSIAKQQTFPPNYSIVKGNIPIGYPFLCDSVSSSFYVLTGNLRMSYILPMILSLICVFLGAILFFKSWMKEKNKAILAFLLFFLGGGFGFAYFFDHFKADPSNFFRIFSEFYQTPTNYTQENIRWVNVIADMLIPQRATLFGWAILFPCIYLLHLAIFEEKKKYFYILAPLAASLPLIHTHSFMALGLLSLAYFAYYLFKQDKSIIKGMLIYGIITILLAAPQLILFTFKQASGFTRFHFNWANETDNYFWFYIKNIGIIYLLAIPAFLFAKKNDKVFYSGALLILLVAEFIQFQPNTYDANKLIFIWYFLTCGIVASYLIELYRSINFIKGTKFIAALVLFFTFISSILTLCREAVSSYELFSYSQVKASEFIDDSTPVDSLFLTSDNHNNAVASLTGRNIVCGSGSYLYFHGLDQEFFDSFELTVKLFENPSKELLRENNIDYVYISPFETSKYDIDYTFFAENCSAIFANDEVTIYEVD